MDLVENKYSVDAENADNNGWYNVTWFWSLESRVVDPVREYSENAAEGEARIHQGLKVRSVEEPPSFPDIAVGLFLEF